MSQRQLADSLTNSQPGPPKAGLLYAQRKVNVPRSRRLLIAALVIATIVIAIAAIAGFRSGWSSATSESSSTTPTSSAPVPSPTQSDLLQVDAPPSQPIEMIIRSIKIDAPFENASYRGKNNKIAPATMDKPCSYTSNDKPYSQPGTNVPAIAVIAGHTGAGVPAVFNNHYDGTNDRHTVALGAKMYLRTESSGYNWLRYTATDLHDPQKSGLSEDQSVWGDGPIPGRLLTISCIQPANPLAAAVRNSVVGWQLNGVVSVDQVQKG